LAKPKPESEVSYTDLYNVYTDMSKKSGRLVYPVDLTDRSGDLNTIAEKLRISKAEAVREAVRHYAEYVRGLEVINYRQINKGQAKKEIESYLKGKERVWTDEISDALRVDPGLVNEALLELWKEGWVEPKR
jgi:hypothetical protein